MSGKRPSIELSVRLYEIALREYERYKDSDVDVEQHLAEISLSECDDDVARIDRELLEESLRTARRAEPASSAFRDALPRQLGATPRRGLTLECVHHPHRRGLARQPPRPLEFSCPRSLDRDVPFASAARLLAPPLPRSSRWVVSSRSTFPPPQLRLDGRSL